MCGIAGVLRIHEPGITPPHPLEAIPEAWLDVLDEGIKHRGPDGQGRFRDRATRPDGTVVDVAFVHRRLSILDHEGGHQPMVHDGERLRPDLTYQPGETPKLAHELCPDKPLVAVVFNGCIYNQHELRTELTQQGAWFESDHSDTEVLVHGWRAWDDPKAEWIKKLEGMFALAIWCRSSGEIIFARDKFGEKPLYALADEKYSSIVIASTATALVSGEYGANVHSLDEKASLEWIRFGYHSRLTPQERIQQLGPGERGQPRRRHTPPTRPSRTHALRPALIARLRRTVPSQPFGSADVHKVDRLLRAAVRARLETDVPLACLLSGGIDSSLISAYASEASEDPLCTLCVRMPDDRFDESPHAEAVARHLGTRHVVVNANVQPAEDLQLLIQSLGLPFGDSSLLPTFWACRAARTHAGVLLSGDGGDELFLGYERYKSAAWVGIGFLWSMFEPLMRHGILLPPRRDPKSVWDKLARFMLAGSAGTSQCYRELLAIFMMGDMSCLTNRSGRSTNLEAADVTSAFDARDYDLLHHLPGDLLRKTDTASMLAGIELRAPFLDSHLAQHAMQLQLGRILPRGQRKGLLKQVARKYLPNHIVDRPKQGFAIPIGRWFREDYGGLRQLLYDHLESADPFPGLAGAGVEINMGFVRQMLREHDAAGEKSINPWHGRDHSQRLYMLLVLSIWAKWLDGLRHDANENPSLARGVG